MSGDPDLDSANRKRKRSAALALFFGACLAGLLLARVLGVGFGAPVLLLAALLLAWQVAVWWLHEPERHARRLDRLMPERRFRVGFDEVRVTLAGPEGRTESVSWQDLARVSIRTTDEGPLEPDVFWVLETAAGSLVVPQGATGEPGLLSRLQQLPGWRDEEVIRAMGCTRRATFTCWLGSGWPREPSR